jgi:hypothetical protein
MRSIGARAAIGLVRPHMLGAAFIMAALDSGVPLREVQVAALDADPRTTVYDRGRQDFDKHAYVVVAFVAGGLRSLLRFECVGPGANLRDVGTRSPPPCRTRLRIHGGILLAIAATERGHPGRGGRGLLFLA